MYDPLTYIYPRTMEQAFGPYATLTIEEEEQMDYQDKIVMVASVLAAIACAIVIALEGKV